MSSNLDAANDHQNVRSGASAALRGAVFTRGGYKPLAVGATGTNESSVSSPSSSALPSTESCSIQLGFHPGLEDKLPLPGGIRRCHDEYLPLPHFEVVNRATSRDAAHIAVATQSQRSRAACWSWITVRKFELSFRDMARRSLECSP